MIVYETDEEENVNEVRPAKIKKTSKDKPPKKLRKSLIFFGLVIVLLAAAICVLVNQLFIYQGQIDYLIESNEKISEELEVIQKENAKKDNVEYDPDAYNYLAIGNSITIHDECAYWWNENSGMAATSEDKDFVHIVRRYLEEKYGKTINYTKNLTNWEILNRDRAEMIASMDPYLNTNLDLVTIQLGENAINYESIREDFEYLILYVHQKAPLARIIVVGDFYDYYDGATFHPERDMIKADVCKNLNIPYVSLQHMKNNDEYRCAKGTVITDAYGIEHIVDHDGVATHPNDKAMQEIAEGIIKYIK